MGGCSRQTPVLGAMPSSRGGHRVARTFITAIIAIQQVACCYVRRGCFESWLADHATQIAAASVRERVYDGRGRACRLDRAATN